MDLDKCIHALELIKKIGEKKEDPNTNIIIYLSFIVVVILLFLFMFSKSEKKVAGRAYRR